jgi:hypothetical protein
LECAGTVCVVASAGGECGGTTRRSQTEILVNSATEILNMLAAGHSAADVARLFRVHRATVSRINATARTASTVS